MKTVALKPCISRRMRKKMKKEEEAGWARWGRKGKAKYIYVNTDIPYIFVNIR